MSKQPTEYGKELIEAVALGLVNRGQAANRLPEITLEQWRKLAAEKPLWAGGFRADARAALLALIAKIREPSGEMVDAVLSNKRKYGAITWPLQCWRDMLSQLLTEIGSPT